MPENTPDSSNDKTGLNVSNSLNDRLIGTTIADRYKVLSFLGRGGMSSVYRAEHILTKKIVALKIMQSHLLQDPHSVRRFQQEATAASRITHPNAIAVHDLGMTENDMPFLTMDYLEGISLSELIDDPLRRLSVDQSLDIFIQACDAIAEAHDRGIVHRDIKPSNIMLIRRHKNSEREDMVKVLDFGIAKITQENTDGPRLTGTGEIFGSPVYMSPEQCLGKELDARSDIYSMGCLMYEVLTGKPPLVGPSILATMYAQMNTLPAGLTKVEADPRFVKDLEKIVLKTLEKDPEKRYATMAALQSELESLRDKKQSGNAFLASANRSASAFLRETSNKLGPQKRVILLAVLPLTLTTGIALSLLSSGLWQKAPPLAERYISYETNEFGKSSLEKYPKEVQDDLITDQSPAWSDVVLQDERPEGQFYVDKAFAEKLMLKHNYPKASERFLRALIVAKRNERGPLMDIAQVFGELAYCKLVQGENDAALQGSLHAAKIFNYLDICSDVEAINAFATMGSAADKLHQKQLAAGAYLLFAAYWDVFHYKIKEREPSRCAVAALQAADFLARSEYDFHARVQYVTDLEALISKVASPQLPPSITFTLSTKVRPAAEAATHNPDHAVENFYAYGISIFDSEGSKGAYNAGAGYNNLGLVKINQGQDSEALTCFKKAERFFKLSDQYTDKSLALVKFSEAECQWRMHQYQDSIENAWTARRQWSSSKN